MLVVLLGFSSLSAAPGRRWWRRPALFMSLSVLVELYWLLVPELYVPDVVLRGEVAELDELLEL